MPSASLTIDQASEIAFDPSGTGMVATTVQEAIVEANGGGGSGGAAIGSAVSGGTAKAVLYVDASGDLGQDPTHLAFDPATGRLGVGTDAPACALDVRATSGGGLAARSAPGAGNSNEVIFENLTPGNYKSEFVLVGGGSARWTFGNDAQGNGGDDFYLYNAQSSSTPFFVAGSKVTFGMASAFESPLDARLGVKTGGATTVGLVVQAAVSQSANLQEWRDSTGTPLTAVPADGYGFPRDHKFDLPEGAAAVGTDQTTWTVIARATRLRKVFLFARVAPTGADLVVDILRSSDGGTTWTSLWATTPANRPKIAAGSKSGTATSFDTALLSEGDLLRYDVAQVGSTSAGSGVIGLLSTTTRNV